MLKNDRGFASIYCLFAVGLFSMMLVTTSFVRFAFESKTDFRYFCFQDLKDAQKHLVDGETALLKLNPLATTLRLQLKILYISLAAAVASENVPLVIQIQKTIQQTKQEQRALDTRQKWLIRSVQLFAGSKLNLSLMSLRQKQVQQSRIWSALLQISESVTTNTLNPHLSISPDVAGDVAPVYRLDPDFETQQTIKAHWSIWFFAKSEFQRLISTHQNWSFECAVRPEQKSNSIIPQISVQITADRL